MHGERHPVDAEALLAHGEFVRALARRLVFDDDRVEMWPKVVLKPGDPKPEWQPVGTIRARDKDVELRMK